MKRIVIFLIKCYRRYISPLTPPRCKYYPTCSCYALTAVERFGALRGSILAMWRLLRCNPWSMGGVDYVPEKFTLRIRPSANGGIDVCDDAVTPDHVNYSREEN